MNNNIAKFLIERYYLTQEHRIAISNQISAYKKAEQQTESLEYFYKKFEDLEKELKKHLEKEVKSNPLWDSYLKGVKGIGPILASSLLNNIDITRAEHASSLWKYCGLAVDIETGQADKRKKGEKISWNPFLKKTCWLIGKSFVKTKGKYRTIYDTSKAFYKVKFPEEVKVPGTKIVKYTKGHIDNMAMRRTVKLFLSDFWVKWREQEGLSVSEPFAHRIIAK
jgi:hypothetical protein